MDRLDFVEAVSLWSKQVPAPGSRGELKRKAAIDLNRKFLAFLSAFRQFVDHNATRLAHMYRDVAGDAVAKGYRQATSDSFDEVFEYRFACKLRNYAQHYSVALGHIDYESRARKKAGVEHVMHLSFDTELLLLAGADMWGRKLFNELRNKPSQFPVDPLPDVLMREIERIWRRLQDLEQEYLERAAGNVARIALDAREDHGAPAFARIEKQVGGGQKFKFDMPPASLLHRFGHDWFREVL